MSITGSFSNSNCVIKLRDAYRQVPSTRPDVSRGKQYFSTMKFDVIFAAAFLAALKDVSKAFANAKSVQSERANSAIVSLDDCDHANSTSECLFDEGETSRKC